MRAFAVRREQIEQGERNVTRVCREGADGALARLLGRACLRRAQREVAQRAQPTLAEHASRGLGSGGEDAMHTARLVDRKSTRLNSSHITISYAVFCLKKKTKY